MSYPYGLGCGCSDQAMMLPPPVQQSDSDLWFKLTVIALLAAIAFKKTR